MKFPEFSPEKRAQVVSIHIFVWRFAERIVPAWKDGGFVIDAVSLELLNHLAGKFRQQRQIIGCVQNQRLAVEARKLLEGRHWADRSAQVPQAVERDLRLTA